MIPLCKFTYKFLLLSCFFSITKLFSQEDYKLWLQYNKIENTKTISSFANYSKGLCVLGNSETLKVAEAELHNGIKSMLGLSLKKVSQNIPNSVLIATTVNLTSEQQEVCKKEISELKEDGFVIKSITIKAKKQLLITAKTELGVLYGVFHFLKAIATEKEIKDASIVENPKIKVRILNHWDNLDGSVERGYAGASLWNWQKLPDFIDQRYIDYARANASVGINGTVLNNVNANALILTPQYLEKVKALAKVFSPYGIKVYLTARFSAPIEIGGLKTADPLEPLVQAWWKNKTDEIYKAIPNFGGFLVKANSEGQPGPQNYGRNHVDGANMLADALAPHGGIVMWRAFVYSEHDVNDRAKQAYSEFVPYDGKFRDNVIVQVKNGAIDFQPREPFHPMFGAMPKTPLMMEFQITQEYLGFSSHAVFLPKLYQEVFNADTQYKNTKTTVASIIDGSVDKHTLTGVAGVANIGADLNWTGHPLNQANWYGFGRLAWNPNLSSDEIAKEWLQLTFTTNEKFVQPMTNFLIESREAVVNYMTPLGLHHIMDTGHHYGPGPWVSNLSRPEWNPVYYHKAAKDGVGFNRSKTGSNATAQYNNAVAQILDNPATCPENQLLWFHHLPWNYTLKNGESLWNGLALKYQEGVNQVSKMQQTWNATQPYIDAIRFNEVKMLLTIQEKEAKWWRDACLLYFQQFSGKELPPSVEKPTQTLDYFQSLKFPFAPGNN